MPPWQGLSDFPIVWLALRISVGLLALWLVNRLVTGILTRAAKRAGVEQGDLRLLKEVVWAIFTVFGVIAVVNVSGLTSEFTVLTISGIIAIALSLALQTTLSNVISGILVILEGSVRTKDLIELSGIKGEVIKLGLRNVWVETSEGNLVIISNSQVATGPLINYSAKERLQAKL